jgi:RNA polymerase sigma factor (sigma-70 family)
VLRDQLNRAMRRLTPRQRAAVVLRYYDDLSFADIAVLLDCPAATARSLVGRGLRQLRIIIDDEDTP